MKKSFLNNFMSRNSLMSKYRLLAGLYGSRQAIRILFNFIYARLTKSQINKEIKSAVAHIGINGLSQGSSTKHGWLYHDYALPDEFHDVHRRNTEVRLQHMCKHVNFSTQRVLDIGCSSGGIAIGVALLGASEVTGIDHDQNMLRVGRAISTKYWLHNVAFRHDRIPCHTLPKVDVIIWLSQWMWIVKQQGLSAAQQLLCDVPMSTGATTLIFESAANEGKAAITGTSQADIERFLHEWGPFSEVRNIGPFPDQWRAAGYERMVFVCNNPVYAWKGKKSIITRIGGNRVRKTYDRSWLWAKDNEAISLKRLSGSDNFPRLLDEGEDWVEMEWAGSRFSVPHHLDQLNEITNALRESNIVHRDICPENILSRDGRLMLIDFEWAMIDGKETPVSPPPKLGRGFYTHGRWCDETAAHNVASKIRVQ